MTNSYGRRVDDIMTGEELTPDFLANLTDSQKIHIKLMQNVTSLNTAVNDIRHDVGKHNALLITGNGELSMQERMRNIEKFIDGLRGWGRVFGGALVVQALGFIVGIIIALVRFLPLLERLADSP